MSEPKKSIRDIIDQVWIKGKNAGLSDQEIIQLIETTIQEKSQTQSRGSRKKHNYTPMTDDEIKKAQANIEEGTISAPTTTEMQEIHIEMPQPLYAPPTRKMEEIHIKMPQPLYAPPTSEIQEMFPEDVTGSNEKPKKL